MMCSPNWTAAVASGWPGLVGGAEQVLVTAAVAADVPAVLAGARFEVAVGVITRAG